MSTHALELENFRNSLSFDSLDSYSKAFDLFKIMGVRSKESVHSNILAALMRESAPHGLGASFLNVFVGAIGRTISNCDPVPAEVLSSVAGHSAKIARELECIDLVIDFPKLGLVVGVENKIWAREQPDQIKRYQETLVERYLGYRHKLIVFLTPEGRKPETMDKESTVPVHCMSYSTIVELLTMHKEKASIPAAGFIDQFCDHLEGYVTGNGEELNDLCWDLFSSHEETYKRLVKGYKYCISRKVEKAFLTLQARLESDTMFRNWEGKIEVNTWSTAKPDSSDIVHRDLDVRLEGWPTGVWVKIYKHTWFGVFPYVRETDINRVQPALPKFLGSPRLVPGWQNHFYASPGFASKEHRRLHAQGNDLGEHEINKALTMVHDCIVVIEEALKLSGWKTEEAAVI